MTKTQTLPVISEAMSSADIAGHARNLQAALGDLSHVYFDARSEGDNSAMVGIYPNGVGGDAKPAHIYGSGWPDVIVKAEQWIANYKITSRDGTIHKMALAIIELTDEHTRCTADMLIRRKFSAATVRQFHEPACTRAGEMAGNPPFRVEFTAT